MPAAQVCSGPVVTPLSDSAEQWPLVASRTVSKRHDEGHVEVSTLQELQACTAPTQAYNIPNTICQIEDAELCFEALCLELIWAMS
jgi:hypothetical protein